MNKILDDVIFVSHRLGGKIAFERQGIYQNTLLIKSSKYRQTWIIKVNDEIRMGVLNKNESAVYKFRYEDQYLFLQPVPNDDTEDKWYRVDSIVVEMRD